MSVMKQGKKWISIVLILAVIAFLLTSCAGSDRDDGLVRLRWITHGSAVPADLKEVIAAANAYSAEKIGVIVDLEHPFIIDSARFASMGHATPFDGWEVYGRVLETRKNGLTVYKDDQTF